MGPQEFFKQLIKRPQAKGWLVFLSLTALLGLYAPFFASSKPLLVCYQGEWYFPFFKALYYKGYYTHSIDLFCNVLMITFPLYLIIKALLKKYTRSLLLIMIVIQCGAFYSINTGSSQWITSNFLQSSPYAMIEQELQNKDCNEISFCIYPPGTHCHWQENRLFSNTTHESLRLNGSHMWASLLFGIRYSLLTALSAVALALTMGTCLGAIAGFLGQRWDFWVGRLIEVWDSVPPLFVILLMVASIRDTSWFYVVITLALFSWTSIARMVRLEVMKQKVYPYVDVLKGFGYSSWDILVRHILVKVVPSLLTIAPFAFIGAITYEAALSFLGLGDRTGCSMGLLIDEARMVYPLKMHLFWPPALFLILWLFALSRLGDLARQVLDPRQSYMKNGFKIK